MADTIGMQRKWFPSFVKAERPYYDISEPKRKLAVKFGAIEVNAARRVEICRGVLAKDALWRTDTICRRLLRLDPRFSIALATSRYR
jgi:hypothetical protein